MDMFYNSFRILLCVYMLLPYILSLVTGREEYNANKNTDLQKYLSSETTDEFIHQSCKYHNEYTDVTCYLDRASLPKVLGKIPESAKVLKLIFTDYWNGWKPERVSSIVDLRNISRLQNLTELTLLPAEIMYYDPSILLVEEDTFKCTRQIIKLVINIALEPMDLGEIIIPLSKLEVLDLSNVKTVGIQNIKSLLLDINGTHIKELWLSQFQTIGGRHFEPTVNLKLFFGNVLFSLEKLDLSNNGILNMFPGIADKTPNLKYLNVSNNFLFDEQNTPFSLEAWTHHNLEELYLGYQGFSKNPLAQNQVHSKKEALMELPDNMFKLDSMFEIYVNCSNTITKGNVTLLLHNKTLSCEFVNCIYPRYEGHISCSSLPELADILDCNCISCIKIPVGKRLKILHTDFLGLGKGVHLGAYHHGRLCFSENVVTEFSFAYNSDYMAKSNFLKQFVNLEDIVGVDFFEKGYFQYNYMHNYSISMFQTRFPALVDLNLAGNFLMMTKTLKLCQKNKTLQSINISDNNLTFISKGFFEHCYQLEYIDMSANLIQSHDFNLTLSDLTKLKHLNLANNKLVIIPIAITQQLDNLVSIQTSQNKQISPILDISYNPFVCNCNKSSTEFIRWFQLTSVSIVNKESLTCSGINGISILIFTLDLKSHMATCFPSNKIPIIISVTATAGFFSIVAFIILVYKSRWTIKYYSYKSSKLCCSSNPDHTYRTKKFDAFVSYCADDRFWVHSVLMKQLEEKYKFKLCIHYRDFPVGDDLFETIIQFIEDSHNIIIIISNNALKSEWVRFELRVAYNKASLRRRQLIIIRLGDENLVMDDRLVAELMTNNNYLHWTDDRSLSKRGNELFWSKLVGYMYDDISGSGTCCCCCPYGRSNITYRQVTDYTK